MGAIAIGGHEVQRVHRRRSHLLPVLCVVVSIAAIIGVTRWLVGGEDWLMQGATLGTALGTIGLAVYTFILARATQKSVEGAVDALAVARQQADALATQADLLRRELAALDSQAESGRASAAASRDSVREMTRSRIDALAPLLDLRVNLSDVRQLRDRLGPCVRGLFPGDVGVESDLDAIEVEARLRVTLKNLGASVAYVQFGGHASRLERAQGVEGAQTAIEAGETWASDWHCPITGRDALEGRDITLNITYHGAMFGEIADVVQWRGNVRFLDAKRGILVPLEPPIMTAGPSQVMRAYPNLEMPEEMARLRAERMRDLQ